jgi:Arc/MetJ family transcription regulator
MRTNIEINDDLMAKAQKLGKTKKAIVEEALQLYIIIENQKKLMELWGKVEIDDEAVTRR